MKLSDQVCTLEQAKRLNDLGVLQGASLFFYDGWSSENRLQFNSSHKDGHYKDAKSCYSAFTVAELSIMLGSYAETYLSNINRWKCGVSEIEFDTQAQSSADMIIYLLEQNILSIEEVNKRLKQ